MGAGRSEERPTGTATVSANISTHSLETKTDCLIIPNRRQNCNWKNFRWHRPKTIASANILYPLKKNNFTFAE